MAATDLSKEGEIGWFSSHVCTRKRRNSNTRRRNYLGSCAERASQCQSILPLREDAPDRREVGGDDLSGQPGYLGSESLASHGEELLAV